MKLALGTVQFGLPYGIANQQGQVPNHEVKEILEKAKSNGLDMLDTAISYGDSEICLGKIGINEWKVVSKLPAVPSECSDISEWVRNSVSESLQNLNIQYLYGLLLHRPQQLLEHNGELLFDALLKIKDMGLVQKIGISIYDPAELDDLCDHYDFDIIQAPFNILDRRLIDSGWMNRLNERKIELHVRSVFLQGLLLMESDARPKKFDRWLTLWECYDEWLKNNKLTPIQACLRHVLSFEEINKVVIGVDSKNQLQEILEATEGSIPPLPDTFVIKDRELLNPACWDSLN